MVVGNTGYALEQALEEPLTTHPDGPTAYATWLAIFLGGIAPTGPIP